jgi:hypothetical protein
VMQHHIMEERNLNFGILLTDLAFLSQLLLGC